MACVATLPSPHRGLGEFSGSAGRAGPRGAGGCRMWGVQKRPVGEGAGRDDDALPLMTRREGIE